MAEGLHPIIYNIVYSILQEDAQTPMRDAGNGQIKETVMTIRHTCSPSAGNRVRFAAVSELQKKV